MEIKLAKTFYYPQCLESLVDEFKDKLEIRLGAESAFDFSLELLPLGNELADEFKHKRMVENFLNRFLEASMSDTIS